MNAIYSSVYLNQIGANQLVLSFRYQTLRLTYSTVDWTADALWTFFAECFVFFFHLFLNISFIPLRWFNLHSNKSVVIFIVPQIFSTNVLSHHFRWAWLLKWMKIEYFTFWTVSIFPTSIHSVYISNETDLFDIWTQLQFYWSIP